MRLRLLLLLLLLLVVVRVRVRLLILLHVRWRTGVRHGCIHRNVSVLLRRHHGLLLVLLQMGLLRVCGLVRPVIGGAVGGCHLLRMHRLVRGDVVGLRVGRWRVAVWRRLLVRRRGG